MPHPSLQEQIARIIDGEIFEPKCDGQAYAFRRDEAKLKARSILSLIRAKLEEMRRDSPRAVDCCTAADWNDLGYNDAIDDIKAAISAHDHVRQTSNMMTNDASDVRGWKRVPR